MLKRAPSASAAALDRFLAGVEGRAFRIAAFAVKHREDALEIVQESMLKLVQKYGTRGEEEWPALFHTILQSRIRDWQRRERVRARLRFIFGRRSDEDDNKEDPLEAVPCDPHLEPSRQLSNEQTMSAVIKAVGELPERQRQAFLLRAWEGLDTADTAKAMRCSEGSVKTHYSRALHALREKLGGLGDE